MLGPSRPDNDFPYWLVALGALVAWMMWKVVADDLYIQIAGTLSRGIRITVLVALIGFTSAAAIGLLLAVLSMSRSLVLRQIARLYIEIMRGVPIIVLLLYVAFVLAPVLVDLVNRIFEPFGADPWRTRDFPLLWRATLALALGYSAFIAEIFRAGLQSVDEGQIEAAEALGMNRFQRFRLIVFPQAIRTILPPLGNDFIAMVKDSSLVSVLGVADITQLGKVTAAGNFRYFETYNIVALIYLILTVALSLGLRHLERYLREQPGS